MYRATTGLSHLQLEFWKSFIYKTLWNKKYNYVNIVHTVYYVRTYLSSSN